MEQQKLPNATTAIVLGSISFIACCCSAGLGGFLFSGIALYLAQKDEKLYAENPEMYSNFSQVKTAKIIAIIGLLLAVIQFAYTAFAIYSVGGLSAYTEVFEDLMKQIQNAK